MSNSHGLGSAPPALRLFLVFLPLSLAFLSAVAVQCTEHTILFSANDPYLRQEGAGRVCGNAHGGHRQVVPLEVPLPSKMKVNFFDPHGKDLFVELTLSCSAFVGDGFT